MENPSLKTNNDNQAKLPFLQSSPRLFAIILVCIAVSSFSVMDAMAKYLGEIKKMPIEQVIWLRLVFHFFFTIIILGPLSLPRLIRSQKPGHQLLRSTFLLGATALNFIALKYLQLDQTITIFFLAPLIVAALAGPLLGEWIGLHRLAAICVGFIGVLLVTRPGFGGIHWAVIYSFGAAISFAVYNIATRYLAKYDASNITQFYSPLIGSIAFAPFALLQWQWPIEMYLWVILILMGFIGGFGHWLLIIAHHYAPAPVLSPFIYTALISMTLIGYLVFNDIPTAWTLSGAGIVILAGMYLIYRETQEE